MERASLAATPRCEAAAVSRCVLVSAAEHSDLGTSCRLLHTRAAIKLRLMERARLLEGVRRRRSEGACLSLPLSTPTEHLLSASHKSRHEAPTDGAGVRLLLRARRRQMGDACLSRPLSTPTEHLLFASHWSCHEAPTDGASLLLLNVQGGCNF